MKVTYRHQPGDPETTEWRGHTFKSGEAVEFDGRTKEGKEMADAAADNPWFEVDGGGDAAKKNGGDPKAPPPDPSKPETPEAYRAYAVKWINGMTSSAAMEKRWKDEAPLRDKVGFGSDDQALIDPLYNPKLENLKKAERAQN